MRGVGIKRAALAMVTLALAPLPAGAQGSDHKWVQSGTANGLVDCVDQNSIVKNPDGTTQYDELVFCEGEDAMIRVKIVDCNQDMSGKEVVMKGRPYNPGKDGQYHWSDEHPDSTSLSAQSAKFVCGK
jgi:hypothetical protein